MSNVWAKNKALIWVLLFVFLFTSVFNTGTAFAGTEASAEIVISEESAAVAEETVTDNSSVADEQTVMEDAVLKEESVVSEETEIEVISEAEESATVDAATVNDEPAQADVVKNAKKSMNNNGGVTRASWDEPGVTSIALQEQGTVISKDNRVVHIIFTAGTSNLTAVYADFYCYDQEDWWGHRADDIQPTGNENEYIATFELFREVEGPCYVKEVTVNNSIYDYLCYDENEKPKFFFEVEPNYMDGFVIDGITFDDGFDGTLELTDEILETSVGFTVEYTAESEFNHDSLLLCFQGDMKEEYVDSYHTYYKEVEYDETTGKYSGNLTFSFKDDEKMYNGTYTLKKVQFYDDDERKLEIKCDEMPSFTYKDSHTDTVAPEVKDAYFTVDGVKCETSGFEVKDGQELKLHLNIDDAEDLDLGRTILYLKGVYEGSYWFNELYFTESEKVSDLLVFTIETGSLPINTEWYIDHIRIIDKYDNYKDVEKIGDEYIVSKSFVYGDKESVGKLYYDLLFSGPDFWTHKTVPTDRFVSFDEMGIEIPEPPKVVNSEFLGWEYSGDYDYESLITSDEQKFYLKLSESNRFYAKYDKQHIVKVNISWHGEPVTFYYGIDDADVNNGDITREEFKDLLVDSGVLESYETDTDERTFNSWYVYEDWVGFDWSENFNLSASYKYKDYQEYTINANGGTFADGSTSKVISLDREDSDALDAVEIPVREGYAFAGWRDADGCNVDNLWDACGFSLYAKWLDASDAEISYAYIKYATENYIYEDGEDIWAEYDYAYIWEDGETSSVTLPFNVHPDFVKLYVKKKDGTYVEEPIVLQDGETVATYESVSPDGTATITYAVTVAVEEPPTSIYDAYIGYTYEDYDDEEGDYYNNSVDFEFEDNTATVIVPYRVKGKLYLNGRDVNGKWIDVDSVVMGDVAETVITYTSKVDGQVYTVKVVKDEPSDVIDFSLRLREYYVYGEDDYDWDTIEWYYPDSFEDGVVNVEVPYGTFDKFTSGELKYGISVNTYNNGTCDIPYNEFFEHNVAFVEPVDGKAAVTFTMAAESGRTETYTVNFVEDAGDTAELSWLECEYMYRGNTEWDYISEYGATTEKGAVVTIPYFYDNEEGIYLYGGTINGGKITGLKDRYYLDENGQCIAEFQVVSANGQVVKDYKVTFVSAKTPKEPFDVYASYYDKDGNYRSERIYFDDNYAEFYIYNSYDADAGFTVSGYDVDDKYFSVNTVISEDADRFVLNSADGKQYTVKPVVLDANRDVSCSARLRISHDWESEIVRIDMREAYETGETTVTVPYGTITKLHDEYDNSMCLYVMPGSSTSEVNLDHRYEDEGEEYYEYLYADENGNCSKTITVIAENGEKRDYKINIVEEAGALPEIDWMDIGCEKNGSTHWIGIDTEVLLAAGEVTIEVPYYYNEESGLWFDYPSSMSDKINGLEDKVVKLDPTGNATVEFTMTSQNGKVTIPYKINFVKEKEQPTELKDMRIDYHAEYESEWEDDGYYVWFDFNKTDRTANVYIPRTYGEVELFGYDVDGTKIQVPVTITDGKGTAVYTSAATGLTYTANVIVSGLDEDTGCYAWLRAYDGESYEYIDADMQSGIKEEAVFTVPYGTITDADGNDDNDLLLMVEPYSWNATLDVPYTNSEDAGGYFPELKDNGDGTYSATFTVTAENGNKQTYNVKVVEDSGDDVGIDYIEASMMKAFPKYNYYDDVENRAINFKVDAEKAKTAEGVTVTVPYSANEHSGVFIYNPGTFGKIKGFDKRYYFDKDGNATVVLEATSPNGKNSETYTIHFVKDHAGDTANLATARFTWEYYDYNVEDIGTIDAELEEALTEEGATITIPAEFYGSKNAYASMQFLAEGYEDVVAEVTYENGVRDKFDRYLNEGESLRIKKYGNATVKVTVRSENTKFKKVYTFNVVAGKKCDHEYKAAVTAPTCTAGGYTTYTCMTCGDSYIADETPIKGHIPGAAATCTIAQKCTVCGTELVAATGHSHKTVVTTPTCTAEGYTTYTCVCGDSYVADKVAALGHAKTQYAGKAATCTEKGWASYETCSRCDYTTYKGIAALGHSAGPDADCTTAQTCVTCGMTLNKPIGHNYKAVVTAPTCTAGGYTTYTCACGDSYVGDKVSAIGHTPGATATCTTAQICTVCKTELAVATGHAWEDTYTVDKTATINNAGSKSIHCEDCDATKSVTKIARIKKTTAATVVYNGKIRNGNVTVVDANGKKLVKGKDFTVTYKNGKGTKVVTPKNVGSYKAVVKFKGSYSGTVTKDFKINPKATAINKLTKPGKKQIKVTWQKRTAQVTGYQIMYSTKKNMNKAKTVKVTNFKTTFRTIKNLKAKQKYWVQVRTYKTVNGVNYFSDWSAKKVITTK